MQKIRIYGAGKMSGLTFAQMNNWRLKAKEMLGDDATFINPIDFYNFNMNPESYADVEVMDFDLFAVDSSHIILVNLEWPDTIGTAIEMYRLNKVLTRPVIAYGGDLKEVHPWMRCCITKYCTTLEDAITYIKEFYIPLLS